MATNERVKEKGGLTFKLYSETELKTDLKQVMKERILDSCRDFQDVIIILDEETIALDQDCRNEAHKGE